MERALVEGRAGLPTGVEGLRAYCGEDGVAVLLIDRPAKRNALTLAMWRGLPGVLERLAADPGVRVLLLSGAGSTFSAGADIAELLEVYADPAHADAYHRDNAAAEEALAAFPHPTVAVIRGAGVGGGCQLAVACDLRFAAEDARLGITPAKLGVVYPAGATARLARLVGPARAKYLLFSADLVTGRRAEVLGLVDEAVPGDALEARALEYARTVAGRSPQTLGAVKDVVAAVAEGRDPQAAVEPWERKSRHAPDVREGLAAFLERRPPRF
ncbi:enoyl-CoA hydratase/isomerase family protein [Peterkaempfera bronchialis]|uniref:enoyl-CoA hydratase/isomerase family protein n=1 Tax=Peterkaempfera bronchialis TaxID=2126346 RepID=UPI003C2FFCA7